MNSTAAVKRGIQMLRMIPLLFVLKVVVGMMPKTISLQGVIQLTIGTNCNSNKK